MRANKSTTENLAHAHVGKRVRLGILMQHRLATDPACEKVLQADQRLYVRRTCRYDKMPNGNAHMK